MKTLLAAIAVLFCVVIASPFYVVYHETQIQNQHIKEILAKSQAEEDAAMVKLCDSLQRWRDKMHDYTTAPNLLSRCEKLGAK